MIRGGEAALIYILGPKITATSNIFYRSGQLDTTKFTNSEHDTLNEVYIFDTTPWRDYKWTQQRGIFWIEGIETSTTYASYRNSSEPLTHTFSNNTVSYAFSEQAAVYTHIVERGE